MNNYKLQSGVLLHPTILPGSYGIGEIGPHAYNFIDSLHEMGQTLWQVLPIGPTDKYNSPYSSISSFAGNHLLISLDLLVTDGLLNYNQIKEFQVDCLDKININDVINFKMPILKDVSKNFNKRASSDLKKSYNQFCIDNSYWLDDYSNYWALKVENNHQSWIEWNVKKIKNIELIYEMKIIQFLFHDQWYRLHQYCKEKGVKIIGDMPIYVGYDSSDVFSNKELFQLDSKGRMLYQSGCPPCEFQEKGQMWGNPLYNWDNHKKTNFTWFKNRFKKLYEMVDIVRLDHFIGYSKYFSIPFSDRDANNGKWHNAPGEELFKSLNLSAMDFNIIVEDLGDVTEDVVRLREKYNFLGMRVLQFDFNNFSLTSSENIKNLVVYTGTHDNDTLRGWFDSLPVISINENKLAKSDLLKKFNCKKENIHWEIINYALNTESNIVIIPIQDILGKNSSARFNIPGTLTAKNWSWRIKEGELTKKIKRKLFELTLKNNRRIPEIIV